jgi:sirohydrochlorin ferrochelatase
MRHAVSAPDSAFDLPAAFAPHPIRRSEPAISKPALLAIAHGSRDPRHAAALHGLLDAVQRARPGLLAELAFLDLCAPDVTDAFARLAASGAENIAVVPLFLSHGYHVGHDIPAVTEQAERALRHTSARTHTHASPHTHTPSLAVAAPIGPDPLLMDAVERRLAEQGVRTTDPGLEIAIASATSPAARDLINVLRQQGAARVAVAAYFLAPGLLYDRARADALAAGVPIAAPLTTPGDEPPAELVRLVLERYAQVTVHEPELAAA